WCLCAGHWKEAYNAYKRGELDREAVHPVNLAATYIRALNTAGINELRDFAVTDGEEAS
ncbi:hypothetical protein BDZ91DRAFT_641838, partial [Kalaharituber pfeilii]